MKTLKDFRATPPRQKPLQRYNSRSSLPSWTLQILEDSRMWAHVASTWRSWSPSCRSITLRWHQKSDFGDNLAQQRRQDASRSSSNSAELEKILWQPYVFFHTFLHSTHTSKIASESIQNRSKISQVGCQVAILAHPRLLLLPTWRQLCPLWTHHGERNPCPSSPKIRKSTPTCSKMPWTFDFRRFSTDLDLNFRRF